MYMITVTHPHVPVNTYNLGLNTIVDVGNPEGVTQALFLSTVANHFGVPGTQFFLEAVTQRSNSCVQSSADRHIRHSFVPQRIVEHLRHANAVLVRYFPERPNNVPETRQLEAADKVDSFVCESLRLVCSRRTSREVPKKWLALLKPVVAEVSHS